MQKDSSSKPTKAPNTTPTTYVRDSGTRKPALIKPTSVPKPPSSN